MRAWWALFVAGACSNNDLHPLDAAPPDAIAFEDAKDANVRDASGDNDDFDAQKCDASIDDPRNCGRCGHDCLGGACEAGVCKPFVLVKESATAIASDNVFVYFASETVGNIEGCPRFGCSNATHLVDNAPRPNAVAVDSTNVYYTTNLADGGYLASCGKLGCDGGATIVSSGHANPSSLIVDNTSAFFEVDRKKILSCALPSCGNGAVTVASTVNANGLGQEWNLIHWADTSSSLYSCQKASCTPKLITNTLSSLTEVAGYGGLVYAMQGGANGKVLRCPNAPLCNPNIVAQNLADPVAMQVDWTGIYLLTRGANPSTDGALLYCPLGGCNGAPQLLIGGMQDARSIAIDQDGVYVAANPIMAIAKP